MFFGVFSRTTAPPTPMNPKGDFVEPCGLNVNESLTQEMPAFDTAGSGNLPTSWTGGLQLSLSLGVQKPSLASWRLLGSRPGPQRTQAINQMHKMWLGRHPSEKDLGV